MGMTSGDSAIQILEGKLEGKIAQGRPRRMWLDDIKDWSKPVGRKSAPDAPHIKNNVNRLHRPLSNSLL